MGGGMTTVSIRIDIHPRCDKHPFAAMEPVVIQQQNEDEEPRWFPAFACLEEGCHRRYSTGHGYFSLSRGQMESETKLQIACPEDGLPMYIDKFESGLSMKMWRCPHFGCNAHHAVRAAAAPHASRQT